MSSLAARLERFVEAAAKMSRQTWSIGLATGASPLALQDGVSVRPILTAADIDDLDAGFVADPFLIFYQDGWYLFFEVWNRASDKGEIAFAKSADLAGWIYGGVVLREPWHLSYPHVFAHDGEVWMLPEAAEGGGARLYRAAAFPHEWRAEVLLIARPLADPTPLAWQDGWYLFASSRFVEHDDLVLYTAPHLQGPWREHAASPIRRGDRRRSRPAGRILVEGGLPLRWAQDCYPTYGTAVRAFAIGTLTATHFAERELGTVLGPGTANWNRAGMHHIDAHRLNGTRSLNGTAPLWMAAVDGCRLEPLEAP